MTEPLSPSARKLLDKFKQASNVDAVPSNGGFVAWAFVIADQASRRAAYQQNVKPNLKLCVLVQADWNKV